MNQSIDESTDSLLILLTINYVVPGSMIYHLKIFPVKRLKFAADSGNNYSELPILLL